MCRICLTTEGLEIAQKIAEMQNNGGNLPPEFCEAGGCVVGLNRFTVTSAKSPHGVFPLESDRYWLAFNGEVYGFQDRAFVDEPEFESDGHFAMAVMLEHGIEAFLSEADLQGTFLIFDKQANAWWCAVDQMNVAGGFFAEWDEGLIIASEAAPIHQALEELGVDPEIPIEVMAPGEAFVRTEDGQCEEKWLRNQCQELFSGEDPSDASFEEFMSEFSASLTEAVRRRIPLEGTVGVLCSGGIDSSVILALTVKFLREADQLDRLKVFTLGGLDGTPDDCNQDVIHTRMLIEALKLDAAEFLYIVSAKEIEPLTRQLYQQHVFADIPRLITPHPILRSQVRNAVVMSSLLCTVRREHHDVITLLTGDGADELLAGYDEMIRGKRTAEEVREEVCARVNYFPLTDGSRVALASFFGSSAANQLMDSDGTTLPVEIRSPFTSHEFMEALVKAHPDFLFGFIDEVKCSKLPLRLLGMNLGVPKEIVLREKMPFNEGATGEKNGVPSEMEQSVVLEFLNSKAMTWDGPELTDIRNFYRFPAEQPAGSDLVPGLTDQMVTFLVAQGSGAERLIMGSMFQNQPSSGLGTPYFPGRPRYIDFA